MPKIDNRLQYPIHYIQTSDCRKHSTRPHKQKYDEYLLSDYWKSKRLEILTRDGFKCHICGSKANTVHHLKYNKWHEENESDLISLCPDCHYQVHFEKWENRSPRERIQFIYDNPELHQITKKDMVKLKKLLEFKTDYYISGYFLILKFIIPLEKNYREYLNSLNPIQTKKEIPEQIKDKLKSKL